ncbi:helix-turn-helix domain-containing protein [archaeon]|nr:helix-turn-helix domain-containing protein [archaeon]
MRAWRERFDLQTSEVAEWMDVSPSVLTDYERGRRRSPGVQFVRRFAEALIALDLEKYRGRHVRELVGVLGLTRAVLAIGEYVYPVTAQDVCDAVKGEFVASEDRADVPVYGFTVIDSIQAILTMSGYDYLLLFGRSLNRVVAFTKVGSGRSPLVAIRVFPIKAHPVVVLHGPEHVDRVAIRIAEAERVPLILSKVGSVKELIEAFQSLGKMP